MKSAVEQVRQGYRVVGRDRQWAQPGNRGVGLAQGSLGLGQMAMRRKQDAFRY